MPQIIKQNLVIINCGRNRRSSFGAFRRLGSYLSKNGKRTRKERNVFEAEQNR